MSNRFHNKFHTRNHHTDATVGDIDSATDPIASPSEPFKGDFHLDGNLEVQGGGGVNSPNGTIDNLESDTLATDNLGSHTTSEVTLTSNLDLNSNEILGLDLDSLSDVEAPAPVNNDVLKWDGSKWVNSIVPLAEDSVGLYEIDETILGVGLTVGGGKINSTSTTPIGGMIMWMADGIPTGWAECNGQGLDTSTYSDLFTVIGDIYGVDQYPNPNTFYLPDMRGMFPRGLDAGRGGDYGDPDGGSRTSSTVDGVDGSNVKTGRNVGTKQDDADQRIQGNVLGVDEGFPGNVAHLTGPFGTAPSTSRWGTPGNPDSSGAGSFSFDNNRVVRTSTETRPNNVYVKFIMKIEA